MQYGNAQPYGQQSVAPKFRDWSSRRPSSGGHRHLSSQHAQPSVQTESASRAESNTTLTVVTAEGDRVTLSLTAQAQTSGTSQSDGNGSTQTSASSGSAQLNVSVDGNLNANEISDLKKLIGALGQATTQAQRTGAADPGALLQSISGLSTVAAFDYSYNQNVETGTLLNVTS
jgi:hypothetical protein